MKTNDTEQKITENKYSESKSFRTPENQDCPTLENVESEFYSKLKCASEDIDEDATSLRPIHNAGKCIRWRVRMYRAVCVFLSIVCLLSLLIIIVLCVKLGNTTCSVQEYNWKDCETGKPMKGDVVKVHTEVFIVTASDAKTSMSSDQTHPTVYSIPAHDPMVYSSQAQEPRVYSSPADDSTQRTMTDPMQMCGQNWLLFEGSCFYLSSSRLTWDESRSNCTASGGDLAVISNKRLQDFLTTSGKVMYWIGLRNTHSKWTWVNKDVLAESYWSKDGYSGNCGVLKCGQLAEANWRKGDCNAHTYFICQRP